MNRPHLQQHHSAHFVAANNMVGMLNGTGSAGLEARLEEFRQSDLQREVLVKVRSLSNRDPSSWLSRSSAGSCRQALQYRSSVS